MVSPESNCKATPTDAILMSDDQLHVLLREFETLLIQRLAPYARFLWWMVAGFLGLISSVIAGTVAVVMFVNEVRNGVRECAEVNDGQAKAIADLDREQRDMGRRVHQHQAILFRTP